MPIEQHMYTSCPPEKGYDRIDGFQTKARSAGVTDAMASLIRHYCGRYRLPRSAQDIEYACRREGRHVFSEAWRHFPVAVTYYPLDGDVFALTRTCYVGQDHSGRFGTFFAHTLVFPGEALEPFDYNPLALTRTHLFQSADFSDRTTLPALPDFQHLHVQPNHSWRRLVTQELYAGQVVHLISAIIGVLQTRRSVILCLPRWDHAAPLIEAMLMLLPAETRCRTAFTTYEHDPYRLQGLGAVHSQSAQLPLQIIVTLSRAEGGAFKFQQDEYDTAFTIFNFVEQRFSPQSSPSPYAQYVADCCRHGRLDRVAAVHKLITDLEVAREPEPWDRLLPAVALEEPRDPQPAAAAVRQAASALLDVARHPTQVATAIKRLWPTVEHLARHDPGPLFEPALQAYRDLLGRLPAHSPCLEQAHQGLISVAGQLLTEGRARRAKAALAALAPHEGEALAAILWPLVEAGWPSSAAVTVLARHEADRVVIPELLLGALQARRTPAVGPPGLATMVAAAYDAAGKVGCLPALWAYTGRGIVLPLLSSLDRADALDLMRRLLILLTGEVCSDGMLALCLWRWRVQQPRSLARWQEEAAQLAQVAMRCSEPQQAMRALVEQVDQLCGAIDRHTVVAAMWEAVGKAPAVQQVLCEAYVQALKPMVQGCGRHTTLWLGRRARLLVRLLSGR
jgi:hypothetical protein